MLKDVNEHVSHASEVIICGFFYMVVQFKHGAVKIQMANKGACVGTSELFEGFQVAPCLSSVHLLDQFHVVSLFQEAGFVDRCCLAGLF